MFGKALTKSNIRGVWTRPTRITELDLSNIHGHIFALNPDSQFKAYEYREGSLAAVNSEKQHLYRPFAAFLQKHQLADLLVLQVLTG